MLRWLMVAVAMFGFALAFGTQSVGLLAFGLLFGFGGLFGALLAFAAARVESVSQTQSSRELSMLLEARKHKTAQRADGGGASVSVGASASGDGGGRGKPAHPDDRGPDGQDGGSDGGGDGGGGGGD
jgi:hypothetical protein